MAGTKGDRPKGQTCSGAGGSWTQVLAGALDPTPAPSLGSTVRPGCPLAPAVPAALQLLAAERPSCWEPSRCVSEGLLPWSVLVCAHLWPCLAMV